MNEIKVYEFDVWITDKLGEKPEKIGKQWIPAHSKKEAFKILRTVRHDEPATYVYCSTTSLKHFDYDAQLGYKEAYEFYKKALKYNQVKRRIRYE